MKCPELLVRPVVDVRMENEVKLKWEDYSSQILSVNPTCFQILPLYSVYGRTLLAD